jgi:hypothetical protein
MSCLAECTCTAPLRKMEAQICKGSQMQIEITIAKFVPSMLVILTSRLARALSADLGALLLEDRNAEFVLFIAWPSWIANLVCSHRRLNLNVL